ncbi:hypothetical protein DFH28DRAFT_901538 [Melampsora americana]|nr:hypothetical protein DFH28DRAFT_901538 [Melampsora americana]
MPLMTSWLRAFQVLLFSSLSIQMDHTVDFEDLALTSISGFDEYGDRDIFKVNRCKRQKFEPKNKQSIVYNLDTGNMLLGPRDPKAKMHQTGIPSLGLSLNSVQEKKSTSLEKFKGMEVKLEDVHDPFDFTHEWPINILKSSTTRSNKASSETSWLTLGRAQKDTEDEMRNKLIGIYPQELHVGSIHQSSATGPWLTLGYQHNTPEVHENRNIEKVDSDTSVISSSLKEKGIDFASTRTLSPSLPPKLVTENPHNNPNKVGESSCVNKNEDLVLKNIPNTEAVAAKILQDSQSIQQTKPGSQQKNSGRPSRLGAINSDFELAHAINHMTQYQHLIPTSIHKDIKTWFSELRNSICEKGAINNPGYKQGGEDYNAVTRATSEASVITTFFLICMKLLHGDQHWGMTDWENRLLDNGWNFIQKLFAKCMKIDLEQFGKLHRYDHVDELHPEVLLNYLGNIRQHKLATRFFWRLWKRWYRDSTYSNKIFLATEDHFIRKIQQLDLHNGYSAVSKEEQELKQSIHPMDSKDYHQSVLQEYILQFHNLGRRPPQGRDLVSLAQNIGKFELDLLEHHVPVVEWLEGLMRYMVSELHLQDNKKRHAVSTISKFFKIIYGRVLPAFLGTLKLMEYPKSIMALQERDETVSDGWKFLKLHLDNLRKIDVGNILGVQHAHPVPEDQKVKETYHQFIAVLSVGNPEYIPLEIIHRLYYLKNAPPDTIDSDTIKAEGAIFKKKLKEIYLNFQNEYHTRSEVPL